MAGIDYVSYISSILPSYLQDDHSKAFMKAFCNEGEELFLEAQSARREGMIYECANDDVVYHFGNASLLQSPFESVDQQRAYLGKKFETWKAGGSVSLMKSELARFGYKNTKVVTWSDLIKMGVKDPFGGGFTKIVGLNINGGMTYFPKRKDVTVVVEHRIQGPSQPLVIETDLSGRTLTVVIKLATDIGGFAISTPLQIEKALNFRKIGAFSPSPTLPTPPSATDNLSDYLGYGHLGTGNAAAVLSAPITLKHGYHSFFFIDIEEPNGFTGPILWNDNTVTYTTYASGITAKRWRDFTLPTLAMGEEVTAIWGNSLQNIWIGTNQGKVFRWDGSTWSSIATGVTYAIRDIWGASSVDIWLVGDSNNALHWNGASFDVLAMPSGAGGVYNRVHGGEGLVWAVGNNGTIAFWNGVSFVSQASGTAQNLLGVYAFSSSDVWAVGAGATILHFDGTSWSAVTHTITGAIQCVWGANASEVWFGLVNQNYMGKWDGSTISRVAITDMQDYMGSSVVSVKNIVGLSSTEVFAFNAYTQTSVLTLGLGAFFYNGTEWRTTTTFINANRAAAIVTPMSGGTIVSVGKDPVTAGHPSSMLKYADEIFGDWSDLHKLPAGEAAADIFGSSDSNILIPIYDPATFLYSKVLHYNGTSWTYHNLPYDLDIYITGMATSATDAWICGRKEAAPNPYVILHWDGVAWTESLSGFYTQSFWANGPNDAWVGVQAPDYLKHWDGIAWTNVAVPMGTTTCTAIWGAGTNKILFAFLNQLTWETKIGQYLGGVINVIATIPESISYGINGFDENRFFVTWIKALISDDTVYFSFFEKDSATSDIYEYKLAKIPAPGAFPDQISPVSQKSLWISSLPFISPNGDVLFWNGSALRNFKYGTDKTRAFSTDANKLYQADSFVAGTIRKFAPTTVTRPSGATGKLWNNGHYWDGTPPYTDALKDIRRIVRKFKPVSTSGRFARIFYGKKTFVYPIGESYEEDASGNVQGPYLSSYLVE